MPLNQNTQKTIALFCLLIYVLFSFLSNAGATLCFGTAQNRHVGIHALSYDSCTDINSSISSKSNQSHKTYKNTCYHSNFQMDLNKIPLLSFEKIINEPTTSDFYKDFYLYEKKHDKINWEAYKDLLSFRHLNELKTIILII